MSLSSNLLFLPFISLPPGTSHHNFLAKNCSRFLAGQSTSTSPLPPLHWLHREIKKILLRHKVGYMTIGSTLSNCFPSQSQNFHNGFKNSPHPQNSSLPHFLPFNIWPHHLPLFPLHPLFQPCWPPWWSSDSPSMLPPQHIYPCCSLCVDYSALRYPASSSLPHFQMSP